MDRRPGSPMTGSLLLVGPDGAGKSTVLDALVEQLSGTTVTRAHLRPGLIAGGSGDGAPVTNPHASPPRGVLGSVLKLAVVWLDTVLGWAVRWRPASRRGVLVLERGWFDQVVDPRRYRLPERLRPLIRMLGRTTPRVDVVVVLTGEPAALHARKPEIGTVEVARQLAAWRAIAPLAGRRVVEVDTVSQSAAGSARAVRDAVLADRTSAWRRVPAAPPRLDLRATGSSPALAVYRPFSPRARAAIRLNGPLLQLGLAPRTQPPPVPRLDALLEALPVRHPHLAAFRSSQVDRWVVGVADSRALQAVVKVGRPADTGLVTELATLQALTSAPGLRVPEVLWSERADDRLAIACAALPAGDEPGLTMVADLCTRLVRGDLGRPVVHGDLAPWNLARTDDHALAVWDWEEARLDVTDPLHDLAHYVIRCGVLLDRWDPSHAAALLTGPDGPGARHLAELGVDSAHRGSHLERYLDTTAPASRAEHQYRDAVLQAAARSSSTEDR